MFINGHRRANDKGKAGFTHKRRPKTTAGRSIEEKKKSESSRIKLKFKEGKRRNT